MPLNIKAAFNKKLIYEINHIWPPIHIKTQKDRKQTPIKAKQKTQTKLKRKNMEYPQFYFNVVLKLIKWYPNKICMFYLREELSESKI